MSAFAPAPKPENRLARYRALSPKAAVHVSPLQLGAMSVGDKWGQFGFGSTDKESSFKLLDAYFDAGGNFIDTANNYQDQTSEQFIGEWAEKRGIRHELVIATKYTSNYVNRDGKTTQQVLFTGNNYKSMAVSLENSLKNLRTSYVDILYLHWWDYDTSVEEVMNGLNTLVKQGKVLYLGVSDTPAWIVSKANQYARDHGMSEFIIYQGAWNVMSRDFEREIIPMARQERMALAPWNVIGGGRLRSDEEEERRRQTGENGRTNTGKGWERTESERKVSNALHKIAKEVGTPHLTAVAIAYVMQKTTHVFPIIGGRKIEHLHANIDALKIQLTKEHIQELESLVPFSLGFPYDFFVGPYLHYTKFSPSPDGLQGTDDGPYNALMKTAGYIEKQHGASPIVPDRD
ncbi:arylalcohol dehydrogenase [Coniophora puteana RWD-64-598 SS2]|uniref:Arylalcohol dehydrogenase n=1 Tax=Coniophora puteana (strain RWD-64-598) TaxID=741705 RepID=A0A5M3MYN4_CONPW|nr:arylalcohol dehydrogenase [Coniophora puteana RWD-64-598 SS2]EIW83711.1 arylalcohol dehydrogenase [Coniophora puteana RWD-64-598 SS2]